MGRKNTNAREKASSDATARMIARIQRQDSIYKAHKRKDEFSMSYYEWLDSKEHKDKRS